MVLSKANAASALVIPLGKRGPVLLLLLSSPQGAATRARMGVVAHVRIGDTNEVASEPLRVDLCVLVVLVETTGVGVMAA